MDGLRAHDVAEPNARESASAPRWGYTVQEFITRTGLSRSYTYKAIEAGDIPVVKFGRRKLIRRDWVEARFGVEAAS